MRINSVPDVKCFCNNKNVLREQSMVRHFVRHPVVCHNFCTYLSARHSYHSMNILNISAQIGFCLTNCFRHHNIREYIRNNIIRNYIHRCHEETLHTLHHQPAAPNTTQLLDAVIDSTCADDGAIPCSSHKLPATKCL